MQDRNVEFPNRFRMVKVEGTDDIYDVIPAPGEVLNPGTLLNKANLLTDETAADLGLTGEDPTVNEAFARLNKNLIEKPAFQKIASYEIAGAYQWTAPDLADGKAYKIGVLIIGAGASGGACVNPTSSGAYYAPGGPSGFSATFVGSVNPGEVVLVVVGAGGQPATKTDSDTAGVGGNAGGSSSFNGVVATGGQTTSRSSTVATNPVLVNGASPSKCTSSASANLNGVWGGAMLILSNSTTIVGRPDLCINPFTGERILGSGGSAYSSTSGTDSAAAGNGGKDPLTGLGGGNGAAAVDGTAAIAEDASLPGCGGGAANVAGESTSATSGAGADGAVYIYFLGVADE